ncbi:MAG: IS1380 family transposase [Polyangiales bacterium]
MPPPQGLLPYTIEVVDDDATLTAHAGLPLVLETMRALGVSEVLNRELGIRRRNNGATDAQKAESVVLLMAAGGDRVEDIEVLRADKGLTRLTGNLPSVDVLLSFLHAFHDESLIEKAKRELSADQIAYIPEESAPLVGLRAANTTLVRALAERMKIKRATLDSDATIQDCRKMRALAHYKGGRGYQPVATYCPELDVVVYDQYRDGNVPAAMGNLPVIQHSFAVLPATIDELYFRADSACYEDQVLKWLANPKRPSGPQGTIRFTISADMTGPLRKVCEAVPESAWTLCDERATETVMCADVEFAPGDWPKDADPLRYVALRIRKKQGHLFGGGYDTKFLAVVSNRRELSATQLIRWHWEKAGTVELVHDVTKNELAAAIPPCGRFGANAAWYRLSLLTYNVLSAIKWLALPPSMETARPKRMRFSLFSIAGRIVSHAGKTVLRIGREAESLASLIRARVRIAQVALAGLTAAPS